MSFFDPTTINRPRKASNRLLPGGTYMAQIDKALIKESDEKMGLMAILKVLDSKEYHDATVMDYFNLRHPSEKAEKYGKLSFAKLLDALKMGNEKLTSEDMIEKRLVRIQVGQKPHYKNPEEMQNYVVKYLPLSSEDFRTVKAPSDLSQEIPF